MEQVKDISIADHEDISFDSLEFIGLIVPVLFAIFAIVLVALSPESSSTIPEKTPEQAAVIEQIHKR